MDGILLVDKPAEWTSFDVVAKVRGLLRKEHGKVKVGHAGTLDPLATGLMIILAGSYCKRAQEFSKLDKTYEVMARLGQTSATGDEEGIKTDWPEQGPVTQEALDAAFKRFTGDIMQRPPAYSALKVNGQRAYKLARAGKEVNLEPRPATIYKITEVAYDHPTLSFVTEVSSGTYIRTLVEDIGTALNRGAYTQKLRRTRVGQFDMRSAHQVPDLSTTNISGLLVDTKGLKGV